MGYSLHATVPVTLKQRLHHRKHEVDVWQGCSGPITHNPVNLSVPEYAPCSCESCRVSGLGVINDIEVLDYEWLVGREVTA